MPDRSGNCPKGGDHDEATPVEENNMIVVKCNKCGTTLSAGSKRPL